MTSRIIKSWGLFEQTLVQARRRYSSTLMARVFSSIPHIAEGLLDRSAPGSGTQTIKGHDHGESGARGISRNLVFSADVGHGTDSGSTRKGLYYVSTSASTYVNFHEDSSAPVEVQGQGYQFAGWVSPGVDNESTAVDGNPIGLECEAIIVLNCLTAIDDINFRWENATEQAGQILTSNGPYSSAQTVRLGATGTPTFAVLNFDDVPCIENTRNKFNLQINAGIAVNCWLMSVVCFESRERSEPQSLGSYNLRARTF